MKEFSLKNKIPLFSALSKETDPDIIFGTETWLNDDIHNPELLLGNYRGAKKGELGNVVPGK